MNEETEFQFQIGSIKSAQLARVRAGQVPRFNSRLVRLKANTNAVFLTLTAAFQFQIGSIKSVEQSRI